MSRKRRAGCILVNAGMKKKALIIFSYPLNPAHDSASLRMYNILQLLGNYLFDITFAVSDDFAAQQEGDLLQEIGIEVLDPSRATLGAHLTACGAAYDLIWMSSASVAQNYLDTIIRTAPHAKLIFDTTDLQYLRLYRRSKLTGDSRWLALAAHSKRWEIAAARASHCTLVVSQTEQEILQAACPDANIQILSNIHQIYGSARPFAQRRGILFVGSFGHHPNQDAMQFFLDSIVPLLEQPLRDEKIWIVGANPPAWLKARETENVCITGHLAVLVPLFQQARLSIAPLRYGAGVKGKVSESMSYGVPVVGTAIAAEGLQVVNGQDMLIADEPEAFAAAIFKLYSDEILWNQLSKNGLALSNEYFAFEAAENKLTAILSGLGLLEPIHA